MNELLAVTRGEYQAAAWFFDVEGQFDVKVDSEVSEPRFERFMQLHSFIQQSQMDVKMRYLQIGCALLEIEREKLYLYVAPKNKTMGYSTFYGFCQEVFGFKKTTAANMVAVAREFCGADGGVKIPYLNFSFAQLVEMLPIEEKYRPRITVQCSTRDIRRLRAYYKDNVPKTDGTVEDDLEAWNNICKKEKEKKNAKKNAITFIPAAKPAEKVLSDREKKQVETSKVDDFDGEDERDIVTPTEKNVSFDAVRNGLYRQLALLRKCFTESSNGIAAVQLWDRFATLVETALRNRFPDYIVAYNEPFEGRYLSKELKEEQILEALLKQVELLREKSASYLHGFCDIVKEAIEDPAHVVYSARAYDLLWRAHQELQEELAALKSGVPTEQSTGEPARGKLYLKNAKERKEWLEKYQSWGVWLDVPEVSKKFYRYDFENGDSLIIEESTEYRWNYYLKNEDSYTKQAFLRYAILDKKRTEYDSAFQGGASGIVDWLSKHAKEI